jgi:mono/diheme cytochrome c family protein
MKAFFKRALLSLLLPVLVGGAVMYWFKGSGFSARDEPTAVEERTALILRSWLTPARYKGLKNPVTASPETLAAGLEHFADHCASCHANDGSGATEMGRNFYPKSPDMRLPRTQNLTDGELFYIIENGVRLTGMPGWSTGTPEGEKSSWQLVHFLRRLPSLTPEELKLMERFNPVSGAQIEEQRRIDEFLNGTDTPAPAHKH